MRLRLFPLVCLFLMLAAPVSRAHELKLSDSEIKLNGTQALWIHKVHQQDFDLKFGRVDAKAIQEYLPQRLGLSFGGVPCRFERVDVGKDAALRTVTLALAYECPVADYPVQVHYDLFYGDLNHRHLLKLNALGKTFSYTFAPGHSDVTFSDGGVGQTIKNFLELGLEHILIGYDHILFVLTLVFGAKRFRDLFWLITSFTLAHSISLALATLGIITLPPTIVEPIIAASIVFLAVQDMWTSGAKTPRSMIFLTFGFGLIHGLGFSYVLQEANLKAGNLAIPLVFFNLGVEMGQILIVSAVYPLTVGLSRLMQNSYLYLKRGILVLIAAVGFYWMVERLFFG